MKKILFLFACVCTSLAALAANITSAQAKKAVGTWVRSRPAAHMTARFGAAVGEAETVEEGGTNLFHVVGLEGGGFVVTSTDDRIQPIIAFSDSGFVEQDERNPLWVMLKQDLAGRMATLQEFQMQNGPAAIRHTEESEGAAQEAWSDLLEDDDVVSEANGNGRASVPDVRVDVLVKSAWDQDVDPSGQDCYNLYTPNNYVCGCVATALSQVMRYFEFPTGPVQARSFSCFVNNTAVTKTMEGGTYDWALMPLVPGRDTTLSQRRAISKLCYDAGVAVNMNWRTIERGGSGAMTSQCSDALTGTFGYKNAKSIVSSSLGRANYEKGIFANLDAGLPVLLGITGDGGHAIVADGYGYYQGTAYTHLNLGWSGSQNAWYQLPNVKADPYAFSAVQTIVYNIFKDQTGELLTGRVLDSAGRPIVGAEVHAVNGSTSVGGAVNARGIYALVVPGGKTWKVTASASGYVAAEKSVYVAASSSAVISVRTTSGASYSSLGSMGNSWGNDFTLAAEERAAKLRVNQCRLSNESTSQSAVAEKTSFLRGETIYVYLQVENVGNAETKEAVSVKHELIVGSSEPTSMSAVLTSRLAAGATAELTASALPLLQNLPVGPYKYRATVDGGSAKEVSFTVAKPVEEVLDSVVVIGDTSVDAGLSTSYTCRATLADGKVVTAEPVWTLDNDGSRYAEIDQTGRLTAKVTTVARSVVVRATCIYNDVPKSGTKVVSIRPCLSLADALDNVSLDFKTDSVAPWFGQTQESHDEADAARSAQVGNNTNTWFETVVDGRGTLSFWYKVSSEPDYDWLIVTADDVVALTACGETSWIQKTLEFDSPGQHVVRWTYKKDVSESAGSDAAWVDGVKWTPDPTPVSLRIVGADEIDAGTVTQLRAQVAMSIGDPKDVTMDAEWSIVSGESYATLSDDGLLTAKPTVSARQVTVLAEYAEEGISKSAEKTILIRGVLPPPDAPVITRAGAGDVDAAVLAWSAADNATSYRVLRVCVGEIAHEEVAKGLTACTFRDATALPGVAYQYRVVAVNASGSTESECAEAHRLVQLSADMDRLAFSAAGVSEQVVTLKANAAMTVVPDRDHDASWLKFALCGEMLTVSVEKNDTSESRSAALIVTAGKETTYPHALSVEVFQDGQSGADVIPDLAFTHLFTTTSRVEDARLQTLMDVGMPFYVRCGWTNKGKGAASGAITNAISIRRSSGEELFVLRLGDSEAPFEPGERREETVTDKGWANLPVGAYYAMGILDCDNVLEESDKDNNSACFRFAVRNGIELKEALDCENAGITFESNEDQWYGTLGIGHDAVDCAVTKLLGDGGTNVLKATLSGAGTLSFDYKVSTEAGYDVFRFLADGVVKVQDSGESGWKTATVEVAPGDRHEFLWIYGKDGRNAAGEDCVYLDHVVWTPVTKGCPPTDFKASDGEQGSYVILRWKGVSGAKAYTIERAETAEGPWSVVVSNCKTFPAYDETPALGGVEYLYRIKTVYADGESDWCQTPDVGYRKAEIASCPDRTVSGAGGADSISQAANCIWEATVDCDWLTFDNDRGTNDFKLVYRFNQNNTGATRKCKITIKGALETRHEVERHFEVTQRVPVDNGDIISLAEATDSSLHFNNSFDAAWFGQTRIKHEGKNAMRSAEISGNATSRVEVAFARAGTLSFWWGTCSEDKCDILRFYMRGVEQKKLSGSSAVDSVKNWDKVTVKIPEGGAVVAWEYRKDSSKDIGLDAGYVSEIVWTPATDNIVPPESWFADYPDLLKRLELAAGEYEAAAKMQSPGSEGSGGKKAADGSDWLVWMDYVCGTNPLESDSKFQATITMEDGVPKVEWLPKLKPEEERLRNYLIYGKQDLKAEDWTPVAEGRESEFNFFKVSVEMQ